MATEVPLSLAFMLLCIKPLYTSHTLKPQQTLFFVFNQKYFKNSKTLVYYITYTIAFSDVSFTPGFSCFPLVSYIVFV